MNTIDNLALVLQAISLEILFKDYNNRDLMQELQNQDEKYLKTIIKQNEQIIQLLTKGSEANGRKSNWKNRRKNKRNIR